MAIRQYIGARYVLKIYENSQDPQSADWEAGVVYEPLVMVNYNNSSYISRKTVPANIGNPVANPTYWALSGLYNGQIANLQNEINDINNELDLLTGGEYLSNANIVVYGDSTAVVQGGKSYMNMAGAAVNATITNRAVGGSYMNHGGNSGVSLINAATDIPDYDYVFLCYGTNEWQNGDSIADIRAAVDAIVGAVRNKNSTAKIIFVTPFYSYRIFTDGLNINARGMTLENVVSVIQDQLNTYGIKFIDFYHRSSCNSGTYDDLLLDDSGGPRVHPSNAFKIELAQLVLQGPAIEKHPIPKNVVPLFDAKDFYDAQTNITNSDVTILGGRGLFLYMAANTEYTSTIKTICDKSTRTYYIKGSADQAFTLDVYDIVNSTSIKTYTVASGNFELFINIAGNKTAVIKLSSVNNTKIQQFNGYILGANTEDEGFTNFGQPMKIDSNSADLTFTSTVNGRYSSQKDAYSFGYATFTLAADQASSTKLFKLDNYFNVIGAPLLVYGRETIDGAYRNTIYPLVSAKDATGWYLQNIGTIPAGNYSIYPQTAPVMKNNKVNWPRR